MTKEIDRKGWLGLVVFVGVVVLVAVGAVAAVLIWALS